MVAEHDGWLPMHYIAKNGHAKAPRILLAARATASVPKGKGYLPMHVASESGHAEVVQRLLASAPMAAMVADGAACCRCNSLHKIAVQQGFCTMRRCGERSTFSFMHVGNAGGAWHDGHGSTTAPSTSLR